MVLFPSAEKMLPLLEDARHRFAHHLGDLFKEESFHGAANVAPLWNRVKKQDSTFLPAPPVPLLGM
jgi:hypothetical protein